MEVKVTRVLLLLTICLIEAVSASPMFGTGGMMKRRFPGSSDMSYNTYNNIANSNTQQRQGTDGSPSVAARFGPQDDSRDSWMFANQLDALRGEFPPQSEEYLQHQYPSSFTPRESYAQLQFPYNAPLDVQYRNTIKANHQQRVYYPYYY